MNTSHNGDSGAGFIGERVLFLPMKLAITSWFVVMYAIVTIKISMLTCSLAQTNFMIWLLMLVSLFAGPETSTRSSWSGSGAGSTPVADCSTLDGDNDGVNDCDDLCPTTLPGVQVSIKGCWIVDVKFDNDKTLLNRNTFQTLTILLKPSKSIPSWELKYKVTPVKLADSNTTWGCLSAAQKQSKITWLMETIAQSDNSWIWLDSTHRH